MSESLSTLKGLVSDGRTLLFDISPLKGEVKTIRLGPSKFSSTKYRLVLTTKYASIMLSEDNPDYDRWLDTKLPESIAKDLDYLMGLSQNPSNTLQDYYKYQTYEIYTTEELRSILLSGNVLSFSTNNVRIEVYPILIGDWDGKPTLTEVKILVLNRHSLATKPLIFGREAELSWFSGDKDIFWDDIRSDWHRLISQFGGVGKPMQYNNSVARFYTAHWPYTKVKEYKYPRRRVPFKPIEKLKDLLYKCNVLSFDIADGYTMEIVPKRIGQSSVSKFAVNEYEILVKGKVTPKGEAITLKNFPDVSDIYLFTESFNALVGDSLEKEARSFYGHDKQVNTIAQYYRSHWPYDECYIHGLKREKYMASKREERRLKRTLERDKNRENIPKEAVINRRQRRSFEKKHRQSRPYTKFVTIKYLVDAGQATKKVKYMVPKYKYVDETFGKKKRIHSRKRVFVGWETKYKEVPYKQAVIPVKDKDGKITTEKKPVIEMKKTIMVHNLSPWLQSRMHKVRLEREKLAEEMRKMKEQQALEKAKAEKSSETGKSVQGTEVDGASHRKQRRRANKKEAVM